MLSNGFSNWENYRGERRYKMTREDMLNTFIQEDCYFTVLGNAGTRTGIHVYNADRSHNVLLYMGGSSESEWTKLIDLIFPYIQND